MLDLGRELCKYIILKKYHFLTKMPGNKILRPEGKEHVSSHLWSDKTFSELWKQDNIVFLTF